MSPQPWAAWRTSLFEAIDRMDADAWASYLAPGAVVRLGNADAVCGRGHCRDAMAASYAQISGLRHQIVERWEHGGTTT